MSSAKPHGNHSYDVPVTPSVLLKPQSDFS